MKDPDHTNFLPSTGVKLPPPSKPESLIKPIPTAERSHFYHVYFITPALLSTPVQNSPERTGIILPSYISQGWLCIFCYFSNISLKEQRGRVCRFPFLGQPKSGH